MPNSLIPNANNSALGAGLSCAAAANMCPLLWSQPYPLSICANLQRTVNYLANLTLPVWRKGNFVERTKRKRCERIFKRPQHSIFREKALATCMHVFNLSGKRTNCTFNIFCQAKYDHKKGIFLFRYVSRQRKRKLLNLSRFSFELNGKYGKREREKIVILILVMQTKSMSFRFNARMENEMRLMFNTHTHSRRDTDALTHATQKHYNCKYLEHSCILFHLRTNKKTKYIAHTMESD